MLALVGIYLCVYRRFSWTLDFYELWQMTVVEVYAGGSKINPPHQLESSPKLRSLLIEGVAQNTNGSVFVPEVCLNWFSRAVFPPKKYSSQKKVSRFNYLSHNIVLYRVLMMSRFLDHQQKRQFCIGELRSVLENQFLSVFVGVIFVLTTTCDCCIGILGWDEFCDWSVRVINYTCLSI
jgi:hypothetical protein